jgi:hypothetical protein
LVALALVNPTAAIGQEGPTVDASSSGDAFEFVFTSETGPSTSSENAETSSAGGSEISYSYEPMCERGEGGGASAFYGCGGQQTCGIDGDRYWIWAYTANESEIVGTICVESGEAAPQAVLTPGRILEAFRRIPVPEPSIGVNPVGGRTLVNFDTILHTEAEPFTETVQLLGRRVTFDIEPSEFSWSLGQGDGFTTTDPGQPYRASLPMSAYVTHRYLRAGDVQLGLQTTWTARWRVGDGPWRPVDGVVTTDSAPVPLEVVTARPQLVTYD